MLALSYQDVYLKPKYSSLVSRGNADISVNFLGRQFKAPWIPANMESVINEDIAKQLSENGYFYIMHRFLDNRKFLQRTRSEAWKLVSISVGVKESDKDLILDIASSKCRVDFITIDIAHGHSVLVKEMIQFIRTSLPDVKIIAGNVCTPDAVRDLNNWGADAVKVGIAGGQACSTKNMTGFHIPMFTCVKDCFERGGKQMQGFSGMQPTVAAIPIIADGGIREHGDIAKALVAGATMVMAGSMFAACCDAPGDTIKKIVHGGEYYFDDEGYAQPKFITKHFKRYYGSASAKQKGEHKHVEGFEIEVPCNGLMYSEKYRELTESLQSSVSYAGGKDLTCFNSSIEWISLK